MLTVFRQILVQASWEEFVFNTAVETGRWKFSGCVCLVLNAPASNWESLPSAGSGALESWWMCAGHWAYRCTHCSWKVPALHLFKLNHSSGVGDKMALPLPLNTSLTLRTEQKFTGSCVTPGESSPAHPALCCLAGAVQSWLFLVHGPHNDITQKTYMESGRKTTILNKNMIIC